MRTFLYAVLSLLFSEICTLTGQNFEILSKNEHIEIKQDSSFLRTVSVVFKAQDHSEGYGIFFDDQLEKVSNIQLFTKKGRRFKEIDKPNVFEDRVELDYITSQKVKTVVIPKNKEVLLTYTISCNELMYLTNLPFFSYNKTDTLSYTISIPKDFALARDMMHREMLSSFITDSSETRSHTDYSIKSTPLLVEPDPLQLFGIYRNMDVPIMRTLVTTKAYKNDPKQYISNWYLKNISNTKGLNQEAKNKIDELTAGIQDPRTITKTIYNYVKSNFKYVAIEIGMGAFIPSPVNEVYLNKQGDCKDLSNFLTEALRYKGIQSDLALAATFSHITDCDFPSLSSANHVIAIAYLDDEIVLLDPTDPIHQEQTPVESLQNRTILIVNEQGGVFHKVKPFSPDKNKILYAIDLKQTEKRNDLSGSFGIIYEGTSANYLKRILLNEGEKDFENFGKTFYEEMMGTASISNFKVIENSNTFKLKGDLTVNGKTFSDGLHTYLFLDFLPRLIETEKRESLIEGTHLINPYHKRVEATITLQQGIKPFDTIVKEYKEDTVSLKIVINPVHATVIKCSYDFIFNDIIIEEKNITGANKILKNFKNFINQPILINEQ